MKRLICFIAIIALFCSCSKDDGGSTGTITLTSGTEISFSGDASNGKSISFTAGSAWSASSSAGWCHISPANGLEGSATINITVDKNQTQESRKANITISTKDASANVTVTQGIIFVMNFSESDYLLPCTGDTIKVELSTNADYEYTIPADCNWIKPVTKTKGVSNYQHYFLVEQNETYSNRDGKIDFINKDTRESKTVTVSQLQKDAIIPASESFTVEANSQVLEFGISSNVDYEITSDTDWIKIAQTETKALINKNISLEISQNDGYESRTGTVVVKSKDITQKVEIIQRPWAHRWTVSILHSEEDFTVPNFSGRNMGGTTEWGDGKSDTYKTGATHKYSNNAEKSTVFNLYSREMYSLEIPVINSIRSIKIVYTEEE